MDEYEAYRARIAAAVSRSPLPDEFVYEIEDLWLTRYVAEAGTEMLFEQGSEGYQARVTRIMKSFGGVPLGAERIEIARRKITQFYAEHFDDEIFDAVRQMFQLEDEGKAWVPGWEQQIMQPAYEAAVIEINRLLGEELFVTSGQLELNVDRARTTEARERILGQFRF